MRPASQPIIFKTITELMQGMGMPQPMHPLVALVNYDSAAISREHAGNSFLIGFYKISFKQHFKGQVKYGQGYYDFEAGGLAFLAPDQLVTMTGDESSYEGYTLYFHADLLLNAPLGNNIDQYGFFAYAVSEALFLSDPEKRIVSSLFESIAAELDNPTDAFSQDILVAQIGLLLHHSNRFYNRQFLTRKAVHDDLISRMDAFLAARFAAHSDSIPTVRELAEQLNVSPRYLTDMLKTLTGKNTQQHIHDRLIAKAKLLLTTSRMHVAEIAYHLGFEHAQSFNKLFKRSTGISPGAFRESFR